MQSSAMFPSFLRVLQSRAPLASVTATKFSNCSGVGFMLSRIVEGQPGLSSTDCCSSGMSYATPTINLVSSRDATCARGNRQETRESRDGTGTGTRREQRQETKGDASGAHRHPCRVGEGGEAGGVRRVARREAVEQRAALMLRPPRQGSVRAGLQATSPLSNPLNTI